MSPATCSGLILRRLGLRDYVPVWHAMQQFTLNRSPQCRDEIWLLEHNPVYTQGLNGKPEHLLAPGDIPVIKVDRGGQVTYHGPGQVVAYFMLDLSRRSLGIRELVSLLEQGVIALLAAYGIASHARSDAPGVYVGAAKIASLGLRVRRGCSYHGLSFNVNMDLTPFLRINPCGHQGMAVTRLYDLGVTDDCATVSEKLLKYLTEMLGENIIDCFDQLPELEAES